VLHRPPPPETEANTERARVLDLARRLVGSRLFSDLSDEELLAIVRGLRLRTYDAGDVVVTEGEPGHSLFTLASGRVKVFVANPDRRNFEVATLAEGRSRYNELRLAARPLLQSLVEATRETANLSVLDDTMAVYIETAASPQVVRLFTVVGNRVPLHATGAGKALLASLSQPRREALLDRTELRPHTGKTLVDRASLARALDEARERGYALDDEEYDDGVRCVAVAVAMRQLILKTRFGMRVRAGASNPEMVEGLGIDVRRVFSIVFSAGTALAGLAGMLAAPLTTVYPGMGESVLILSFVVVVIGGIGSIKGAFLGALLVGLSDTFGKVLLPQAAGVLVYVLMALILLWKPDGLFKAG